MSRRALSDRAFRLAGYIALGLCLCVLGALLFAIAYAGLKAVSFDFLVMPSKDFGAAGGIRWQIIGSLLMAVTASALVLPFATALAVYRADMARSARVKRFIDLSVFSLNGIPSIAYGLFGLIVFVNILGTGLSWFVGSIILAMMMMPTVTHCALSAMQSLPSGVRENGYALGLTRRAVITRITLPQSLHGIVTGLMIGLARAIGETAPIMFIATAFSGVSLPSGLQGPVSTLPTHILALAQQATNPDALRNAWGASFVLIGLVFLFSTAAFIARTRLNPYSERL